VIDGAELELGGMSTAELSRWFPSTELVHIGDEIADGVFDSSRGFRPLALFDGPRTDFSLARLRHYTGTPPEHFQQFVLFTNYVRYVDEFVRYAIDALRQPDSPFVALSVPGRHLRIRWPRRCGGADCRRRVAAAPDAGLPSDDRQRRWVTLVNIGVGPSNAKTICDHIAVLRPEAWLMIGHCGGLRPSQTIGDYVLAHAYLRDDHVLDDVLPPEIPIPAIAEVQTALFDAAVMVTGEDEDSVKRRLRTGTVVTTDDRNWELRYTLSALRFNQSRAVAHRHGIGDRRRPGLPFPGPLRHPALRLRQAAARRAEAAGPGQCLLRAGDQPAFAHWPRDADPAEARGR
jgi:AMP nucleosidase